MFAIVVGLFAAAIVGIVQLATLMPQYSDQIQQELGGLQSWLAGMGVTQADIQSMFSSIAEPDRRRSPRACCPASPASSPSCCS